MVFIINILFDENISFHQIEYRVYDLFFAYITYDIIVYINRIYTCKQEFLGGALRIHI